MPKYNPLNRMFIQPTQKKHKEYEDYEKQAEALLQKIEEETGIEIPYSEAVDTESNSEVAEDEYSVDTASVTSSNIKPIEEEFEPLSRIERLQEYYTRNDLVDSIIEAFQTVDEIDQKKCDEYIEQLQNKENSLMWGYPYKDTIQKSENRPQDLVNCIIKHILHNYVPTPQPVGSTSSENQSAQPSSLEEKIYIVPPHELIPYIYQIIQYHRAYYLLSGAILEVREEIMQRLDKDIENTLKDPDSLLEKMQKIKVPEKLNGEYAEFSNSEKSIIFQWREDNIKLYLLSCYLDRKISQENFTEEAKSALTGRRNEISTYLKESLQSLDRSLEGAIPVFECIEERINKKNKIKKDLKKELHSSFKEVFSSDIHPGWFSNEGLSVISLFYQQLRPLSEVKRKPLKSNNASSSSEKAENRQSCRIM